MNVSCKNKGRCAFVVFVVNRKYLCLCTVFNSMLWERNKGLMMQITHEVPLRLSSCSNKSHVDMQGIYVCCFLIWNKISVLLFFNHLWLFLKNLSWFQIELYLFSLVYVTFFNSSNCTRKQIWSKRIALGDTQKQIHPSDKPAASCSQIMFVE